MRIGRLTSTSKYDLFWPMPLALSYFQLGPFQWSVWDMAGECAWRCSNKTFLQSAFHSTVSQLNSTLQVASAALPCVAQIADCTAAHTPQYTSSWSKTTLQWCGWLVTTNHFLLCYICYICIHCCYICIRHLLRLKFPSKEWPGPKVFCQYAAVHSVGLNWNDRTKFNLCVCKPSWHETFPLNQLLTAVTDFGWPKTVSASRSRSQEKDICCSSGSESNPQMPLVLQCHPVVQATPAVHISLLPNKKAQSQVLASSCRTNRPWSLVIGQQPSCLSSCCPGRTSRLCTPSPLNIHWHHMKAHVWSLIIPHVQPQSTFCPFEYQSVLFRS